MASALRTPEDYPADVSVIIQDEARRRGLEAGDVEPLEPLPAERAAQYVGERARRLGPGLLRSPLLHAAALAAAVAVLVRLIPPSRTPAMAVALSVVVALTAWGGLAWFCRPMRSYRLVLTACGVYSLALTSCGLLAAYFFYNFSLLTIASRWGPHIKSFSMSWLVLCLPLWLVVFLRRKYWPAPPEGHCQTCGYSLQGLPEPRCPECGEAF